MVSSSPRLSYDVRDALAGGARTSDQRSGISHPAAAGCRRHRSRSHRGEIDRAIRRATIADRAPLRRSNKTEQRSSSRPRQSAISSGSVADRSDDLEAARQRQRRATSIGVSKLRSSSAAPSYAACMRGV